MKSQQPVFFSSGQLSLDTWIHLYNSISTWFTRCQAGEGTVKVTEGAAASVLLQSTWPWNWSGSTGGMHTGQGELCKQDRHSWPEFFLLPSPQESSRYEQSQQHMLVLFATYHWRQSLQPVDDGPWQWCPVTQKSGGQQPPLSLPAPWYL